MLSNVRLSKSLQIYKKSEEFSKTYLKEMFSKLVKNKKESPQAVFSEVLVEVNQVPQGSNLAKIKELVQKKQNLNSSKTLKQILEKFYWRIIPGTNALIAQELLKGFYFYF